MRKGELQSVVLTAREWERVLWCVDSFDFNPSDRRASALRAKIEDQVGVTKLLDGGKAADDQRVGDRGLDGDTSRRGRPRANREMSR